MTIVKTLIILINVKEIVTLQNPFIVILCYLINTFAASYLNTQGLNNSCLKSRHLRP